MTDIIPLHHLYNRGAHKAPVFLDDSDRWRMIKLLYIANNTEPFILREVERKSPNIFETERQCPLVDIVAYCLMPNHVHIAVRPRPVAVSEGNPLKLQNPIARFMEKLMTGYSGYFNRKYDHSGTIWQGAYKEKIGYDVDYENTLIDYIHLNPYGIIVPDMTREARAEHQEEAIAYSREYEFSSFKDYLGFDRPQKVILHMSDICKTTKPPPK